MSWQSSGLVARRNTVRILMRLAFEVLKTNMKTGVFRVVAACFLDVSSVLAASTVMSMSQQVPVKRR